MSGTLAVRTGPPLSATLTGPFGTALARYEDGALTGEGIRPLAIASEDLQALLAGVWKAPAPTVEGVDGEDALLAWNGSVSGVLSIPAERFVSLRVERAEGTITAGYSGSVDPWPRRIELADARSGNKLRLVLIAREPSE